jgi:predicted MFS family arabinose efflux permease
VAKFGFDIRKKRITENSTGLLHQKRVEIAGGRGFKSHRARLFKRFVTEVCISLAKETDFKTRLKKRILKYDRTIWVLFIARLINSFGYSIVMPFLAVYLSQVLHIDMFLIGTLYAFSIGIGAGSSFIGGEICDRWGRKNVLLYSIGFRGLTFFFIAISISLMSPSFVIIATLVIMSSALGGLYRPALDVLVADYVPPKERMEVYGIQRIAGNLGFSLGPIAGGFAAVFISYTSLFVITAACSFATFALILAFVKEPNVKKRESKFTLSDTTKLAKDRPFLCHTITSMIMFIVSSQLMVTLSIYSVSKVGISLPQMGILFTVNGLMVVFLQFIVTRIYYDTKITTALAIGAIFYGVGYLSIAFATSFYFLLVSMVVITLGELIVMPSQATLVANLAPADQRGRYMGFFGLFTEIGHSMGPLIGGTLMNESMTTPLILWGVVGAMAACASAGYILVGTAVYEKKSKRGDIPPADHKTE